MSDEKMREEFEAFWNAPEQEELRMSCAKGWAMVLWQASRAAPAVQGEPVGRVKTIGGYPDESEHTVEWLCKYKDLRDGDLLYTTPQPAEQKPAPDVAGLLNRIVPRIDARGPNPIDPDIHCCEWTLHRERERIHAEFADALSSHCKQQENK